MVGHVSRELVRRTRGGGHHREGGSVGEDDALRVEVRGGRRERVGFVTVGLSWDGDRDDLGEIRTDTSVKEGGLETEEREGGSHRARGG